MKSPDNSKVIVIYDLVFNEYKVWGFKVEQIFISESLLSKTLHPLISFNTPTFIKQ
jgi:hypothetical protein